MGKLARQQFAGRHWETGSVQNALAWRGVKAPHTGEPYSEALLLGLSGGLVFGYFVFEYQGHPPILALLTRNTFAPMDTLLERLGGAQDVRQTTNPAIAARNLDEALDSGHAAVVWADSFSLPYNGHEPGDDRWGMQPILVFGREDDTYYVADRSRRPFPVPTATLAEARGRIKKERHRQLVIEPPNTARLAGAVTQGLRQCVRMFTEAPPKGTRDNFGFAAFQKWAKMLTNTKHKQSWARVFAPGPRLFHGLAGSAAQPGAFDWIMIWGAAPDAERGLFAGCLDEAAVILKKPRLSEAAEHFRASAKAWHSLAGSLLPSDVPLLGETKALHLKRHKLFTDKGPDAVEEIKAINQRLNAIEAEAAEAFPLDDAQTAALRESLAAQVIAIHDVELKAVEALQRALGA